jgi:hypothetical protein
MVSAFTGLLHERRRPEFLGIAHDVKRGRVDSRFGIEPMGNIAACIAPPTQVVDDRIRPLPACTPVHRGQGGWARFRELGDQAGRVDFRHWSKTETSKDFLARRSGRVAIGLVVGEVDSQPGLPGFVPLALGTAL